MEESINLYELTFSEKDRYVIITNAYPHEDQLYRNGFIHRRVKAYLDEGLKVDVFVLHPAYKKQKSIRMKMCLFIEELNSIYAFS